GVAARGPGARFVAGQRSGSEALQADDRGLWPHHGGILMNAVARKPIDGAFRSWSDGRCVHLLVQFTGGNLGRSPVTMHATTDLAPARAAVRRRFVSSGDSELAGDPVATEAMATRVGLFSAFRRIGRAAK